MRRVESGWQIQARGSVSALSDPDLKVRLGTALFLLVVETDLDGGITIGFDGFGLKKGVAGDVDDGDGDHGLGVRIEQPGHTEFFTKKAE